MSLIVTFNGQFKPYRIPSKNRDNVHRIRNMAPSFNDLMEHFVDKDTEDGHTTQSRAKKSKISSYVENQKIKRKKVYARDLMTTKIHSLSPKDTVATAMELLSKYKIRHIPIVENKTLVGIVSDGLLLGVLGAKKLTSTTLAEVMVKEVLAGQEHSSISDIARVMLEENVNCIPITTDSLELKGIVTTRDILELLTQSFPLEIYA